MMNSTVVNDFMNAGLSFIPCYLNKKPMTDWLQWQEKRPDRYDLSEMPFLEAKAVALIAGPVSGNLECIDFDVKNDPQGSIWNEFKNACSEKAKEILKKCVIQRTPSGGYHIIYKCEIVGRNEQLAYPKENKKPIIETRGAGGYFLVNPSPGYEVLSGDMTKIETITASERHIIIEICRNLTRRSVIVHNKPLPRSKREKDHHATVSKIVADIEKAKIDITSTYDEWLKVGLALAHQFGDEGREYYHRLSRFHPDYDELQTDRKYDSLLVQKNKREPITIRTFFSIAQDYGADIRDVQSQGLTEVQEWVKKQGLRYNEVTKKIETRQGDELDDMLRNDLWNQCELEIKKKVAENKFRSALFSYHTLDIYNPITEYFDKLLNYPYEGSPLDEFLGHLQLVNDDWKPFIRKWLIGVVAGAYGNPTELILVLVGTQGNGKTEFFARLLPKELSSYYTISNLDHGKDSDILMTEKLIILDDEWDGKSKKNARHLKAKASIKSFSLRVPYGRTNVTIKRLCALCGAANLGDVINDNTGNRRIIPVELVSRDYKISDSVDRAELWAQIVQEYFAIADEEGWKLTPEELIYLKGASEEHQAINHEREAILTHYKPGTELDQFMSATMMAEKLSEKYPSIKFWPNKVGQELNILDFPAARKRVEGKPLKGYWVTESPLQIEEKEGLEIDAENLPF